MNVTKVSDIIEFQFENYPLKKSISGKKSDNSTYSYSTEEVKNLINKFSMGLLNSGIKKGDKISLISCNNLPEWNIADLGMLQIGVINVSVYSNISDDDFIYIFNNAKVKYCIVGQGNLLDKLLHLQPQLTSLERIFTFGRPSAEKDSNGNAIESWEILLENEADDIILEKAKLSVTEDDLATIIYTSGTTGTPKGVMLSHKNISSNIKAISETMLLDKGDTALSYLPLCHGFERTFVYCYIYKSIEIYYALNQQSVGESIKEVRPHIITAVPRVLEKIYEKIFSSMQKSGWLKRSLFFWSDQLTHQYDFNKDYNLWFKIKIKIADKLVFSKIREKLGGRIKVLGVGASACPQKIMKFFCAAGIPVREGYGLTETSAVLSVNHIPEKGAMMGTVGILLPDFEIKIMCDKEIYKEGEGEIIVRGVSVTRGYYEDPVNTAEAFNDDGWFLTGDIGTIVKNKSGNEFIKLTNRKKELLKSSNGKYIAPMAIENRIKESFFVSQVMIIGEQRKYVSALIVPEFDTLKQWSKNEKIEFKNLRELTEMKVVKEKYQKITDETNKHLAHYEQIKRFILIPDSWEAETGELTPTLKLKRKVIEEKYADLIERMYER